MRESTAEKRKSKEEKQEESIRETRVGEERKEETSEKRAPRKTTEKSSMEKAVVRGDQKKRITVTAKLAATKGDSCGMLYCITRAITKLKATRSRITIAPLPIVETMARAAAAPASAPSS